MRKFLLVIPLMLFLLSAVTAFTPDNNTSFYLTFDECVGDDLTDSSIYALEGELVGSPTWLTPSSCINSCCLSFDGVNDNAYFSDADSLDMAGDFSIGVWVRDYDNGTSESRRIFVGKDNEGDASTPNYEMYFSPAGETATLAYRTGTTLKSGQATLTNSNEWVCLVGSKNATDINVFVNGVLSSTTAMVGVPNVNAKNLRLATNFSGGFYHVVLDELVIENISVNETWASNFCDVEQLSCDNKCTDWVATSNCTNGKQQYIRTCPDTTVGCEIEYWNSTVACELAFNRTQGIYVPQFEWYHNDTWCESEWLDIEQQAECILPPIQIPYGCTNVTVVVASASGHQGSDKDTGDFDLETCTPIFECDNRTVSCDLISEGNESGLVKIDTTYTAGEIANAKVTLSTDLACGKTWFLGAGVTKHKVAGAMYVDCLQTCLEEWECVDGYERYKRIDCSHTNQTYCTYGCGAGDRCAGASATPSSDLAFGWLLNPSPTTKAVMALAGSLLLGIIAFAITKFKEVLVFIIGFACGWVFFTFIGWIPAILTIILLVFGGVGLYFKMSK